MSQSHRSYYACLAGATLLVVLLAVVAGHTVPAILDGRSTALIASIAAVILLVVAAVLAFALIAAVEFATIVIAGRFYTWRARRHAARRRGYLTGGPRS